MEKDIKAKLIKLLESNAPFYRRESEGTNFHMEDIFIASLIFDEEKVLVPYSYSHILWIEFWDVYQEARGSAEEMNRIISEKGRAPKAIKVESFTRGREDWSPYRVRIPWGEELEKAVKVGLSVSKK